MMQTPPRTSGPREGAREDNTRPRATNIPLWNKLIKDSKYWERKKRIDEFNKSNTLRKRGIVITPARYGMIRAGGQGARIDILRDGSIQIGTSGIEMGQGTISYEQIHAVIDAQKLQIATTIHRPSHEARPGCFGPS